MKQTILKYSNLLALLCSLFWSSYLYAGAGGNLPSPTECANGATTLVGCAITATDTTYSITGDITPISTIVGIYIGPSADNNNLTLLGNLTTDFAAGIYLDESDFNTITLTGNISTTDTQGYGLYMNQASNNTTTINGNITTTGGDASGLIFFVDNTSNTTTLNGNIRTSGAFSYGLYNNQSNSNTTNIVGDITTLSVGSVGLFFSSSDSNTTNITGDITTSEDAADGIRISSSDSNTTNITGNISTAGLGAEAFFLYDSNRNTTTITGNILTAGDQAPGIYLIGDGILDNSFNTVTMQGDISTTNTSSSGISIATGSNDNTISMEGNITTSEMGSHGIEIIQSSNRNVITMTGNIVTNATDGQSTGITIRGESDSNTINMTGNISTAGINGFGFYIFESDSNTTNITGNITTAGSAGFGIFLNAQGISRARISNNTTTLTGDISTTGQLAFGVYLANADNNTTSITGNISTTGQDGLGVYLANADNNTLVINGNISTSDTGGDAEPILLENSDSNTLTLSGMVQALGGDQAISIDADSDANTFNIQSGSTFLGDFENLGTNTVITNQGVMDGIDNTGSIATFNNAQTGATYSGTLPVNYNIIINSPTSYGQMFVTSEAGSTNFGLSSVSTSIFNGKYSNVMTGVSDGNVGATRSGSLEGNGTSAVGTANWVLTETASDSSAWDLNITGDYVYFGSVATLQNSLNNTASAMRGAFNSITSSMNFANMTTYDCNLFGNNGGCVSVGGRYTGTDNSDTTATAVVAKAGYKFNEHFRYGAFMDQTANSKTGNVDLDLNTPMVGLMGVWNQNANQLGMQVKLANTFQSTDASITRNDGLSTNYTGDTDINAQSYVAELSWRHLNHQKDTLLQPFVATRYAIIDQDGYSDGFVNYGSVEQKTLTALVGVKAFYQYSHKMTYMGSLGVEHDLDEETDDLSVSVAGVSGLTAADMDGGEDKTRLLGSVGARFFVTPNQRLEGKLMYEQLRYNNADNTTAYVNYTIGF